MKCFKCNQGEIKVIEKSGKKYAQCNECGSLFTTDDIQKLSVQRYNPREPEEKKGSCLRTSLIIAGIFLGLFILVGVIANLSSDSRPSESQKTAAKAENEKNDNVNADEEASEVSDEKELNSQTSTENNTINDVDIYFMDSVRNDNTGKWRLARITTSKDITEYAKEYHNVYFSADDEIHALVNFTLNTTSSLSMLTPDLMDIRVMEYVDKEEHDADKLFSGPLLAEYHLTLSTGEIEKIQ